MKQVVSLVPPAQAAAGLPTRHHPAAGRLFVLRIDISGHRSKHLEVFRRVRDEIQRVFGAYAAGRLDARKG